MVPHDLNPRFHGRKETLEKITDALRPVSEEFTDHDAAGLRSFAISGRGGIGKTQVAVQYVYNQQSAFDAILWVHADSIRNLRRSFRRIAGALGLTEERSAEAQDNVLTRELVLGWLARPLKSYNYQENEHGEKASWLLIFDNADDRSLLEDFWPRNAPGSILITSRDPLLDFQFFSVRSATELPPFDLKESTDLLLQLTNRGNDDEDRKSASAVAEILECMPLAVVQMAGSIVRRDITFAEFLREYKDPRTHATLFRQPAGIKRAQDYEHTLFSVWALEKLGHGVDLLDILAFLDPSGIPEDIFLDNHARADMDGIPRSEIEYGEARAELMQSSLVSRHRSTQKLFIHRLIQDTVRARMSNERYSLVFVSTLQLLSGVWPYEEDFGFIKNETVRWIKCNELYRHVLHLMHRKLSVRLTPPTRISKAHIQPPRLVLEAAW